MIRYYPYRPSRSAAHLAAIGYDERSQIWKCPTCSTLLRPSQIHVCLHQDKMDATLIYFVDGVPVCA